MDSAAEPLGFSEIVEEIVFGVDPEDEMGSEDQLLQQGLQLSLWFLQVSFVQGILELTGREGLFAPPRLVSNH